MKKIIIRILLIIITGVCLTFLIFLQRSVSTYTIVKNPECTYIEGSDWITAIPGQKLDVKTCFTLGFFSAEDVAYASSLTEEVIRESKKYIKARTKHEAYISHARKIGDFILIFVHEPNVADGGFEFIYSIHDKKVAGTFMAGIRG